MKKKFLEQFEEKFYFKTSHYFWHFLTAVGGIALLIGALILLWGITPSIKPGVRKPKLPKPVKVGYEEVLKKIQPPPKKKVAEPPKRTVKSESEAGKTETETQSNPDEAAYLASLDSLKTLLPPDKFSWKSRGHWQRNWYDKKWVVDVWGISDRLKSIFRKVSAEDFKVKKQLVDSYISIVALFPEKERFTVLKAAIDFSKSDVYTSVQNIELLNKAVPLFSTENANFIKSLATFGKKNPRDGRKFIEYVISTIPKFDSTIREDLLSAFIKSYYNYFNLIEKQKEATNLYLDIFENFETANQVKALTAYYKMYVNKNRDRDREIERLEREYRSEQSHAESVLYSKKARKSGYRILGLEVVGGSIVFIAFVAMFLVLLSIQRNVKLLRDLSNQDKS